MANTAAAAHPEFDAVIGLEVHCQLATESKIFCGCPARVPEGRTVADWVSNQNTCPVCAGHPGALPVVNRKAVEYAVRAGLATHCRINERNVFARKNYFYPDSPKGYQISQFDLPICENGYVDIETAAGAQRINIQRIHMEEDAGKNTHHSGYSLVNLNRAGTPLVEIVTAPDMTSAEQAGAYLRALYAIVTYIGICDGNLQEGNFRCDANVSVKPKGSATLGTRTEIKNVNSFKFVEKAIEFEIRRQIEVIKSGGKIVQETRTYDADADKTMAMRSKEEAHDYRYFPDPDLLPIRVRPAWIEEIRRALPELPDQKRARYVNDLGLSPYDAGVLTASPAMTRFYESSLEILRDGGLSGANIAKATANLLIGEIARRVNEEGIEISAAKLKPRHLAEVAKLLGENTLSATNAKVALTHAWRSGDEIGAIVEQQGLRQVSDTSALEPAIDAVIAANPSQAAEFRAGKDKLIGFFVGHVMKATGGKANPALLQELIRKKLS